MTMRNGTSPDDDRAFIHAADWQSPPGAGFTPPYQRRWARCAFGRNGTRNLDGGGIIVDRYTDEEVTCEACKVRLVRDRLEGQ